MKKGILVALMLFAVLFASACGASKERIKTPVVQVNEDESKTYPAVVDYTKTLYQMITDGKYDLYNPNITPENFPIFPVFEHGKTEVAFQIIHPSEFSSTKEIIAEMNRCNLRPATLPELLAFGAKYPDIQRQFPIVALGSIWRWTHYAHWFGESIPSDERRYVATLFVDRVDRRWLGLFEYDVEWTEGGWRFLAVPK